MAKLYKRNCVTCGPIPTCPVCDSGEVCQITVRTCDTCPETFCAAIDSNDDDSFVSSSSSLPSATPVQPSEGSASKSTSGAIAGGVIGGCIGLAIIIFLIWRYFIARRKPQRHSSLVDQTPRDFDMTPVGKKDQFQDDEDDYDNGIMFSDRMIDSSDNLTRPSSRHTMSSMASTALTRASNIIPIAYIPGVSMHSAPKNTTPAAPPIPRIPRNLVFTADDIMRDSVLSRNSMTTNDIGSPRSNFDSPDLRASIDADAYRNSAVVPPQQMTTTAISARPNLVTVTESKDTDDTVSKSGSQSSASQKETP
ncbi:hypothetical protein CANCADRAFT_42637 [Tortispora caseinolytica NRRL Y-17796]|uniref:Membrane anchor Opy2 N-terminal domain-containing protein n=1 Tax=Tortispora caseinolytica NRRL Y-17796 TaxID=767744 RepID=A0A1E4TJW8_9ASCO|nr:hypothetical protein CANCADRAFT_42637 [Tortispora caseinolytica NRRL Y-17796]